MDCVVVDGLDAGLEQGDLDRAQDGVALVEAARLDVHVAELGLFLKDLVEAHGKDLQRLR